MLVIGLFIIFSAFLLFIYMMSRRKYDVYIKTVDQKEFPMKSFLNIGFYLLEKFNYGFDTRYDRNIENKYVELYDVQKAKAYLRLYWANKISLILLIIFLGLFFSSIICFQSMLEAVPYNKINIERGEIQRPEFGEGNRILELSAEIEKGKVQKQAVYKMLLRELPPKTARQAVDKAWERLTPAVILGKNKSMDAVRLDLALRPQYDALGNTDVTVQWHTDNQNIISEKGVVTQPEAGRENQAVKLTAIIKKEDEQKIKNFRLNVLSKAVPDDAERVDRTIEEIQKDINKMNRSSQESARVMLPKGSTADEGGSPTAKTGEVRVDDIAVKWHIGGAGDSRSSHAAWLNAAIFLLIMIIIVVYALSRELNNRVKKRRRQIQYEFPDFINKITLLVNAGMTVSMALEKTTREAKKNTPLYKELAATIMDIQSGKPEIQAYEDFAARCKVVEASKLVSAIIQNIKKGNSELVTILRLLSSEFWETRKNIAKRMGEEASTKLLLPMILMLMAILIIVLTPALMALNSF